jgi:hypothetical protein
VKIVQSFWSGKKNLVENNFGWLSPQYHVMAWTLSCLKLKEHYDDLHLYTDTNGYDILINYLKLPYKNVNVCYDAINDYHTNLWALPKIMTYAKQDRPFIHVDGDVFVWERFNNELESAGLITQNKENGTAYYKGLMNAVKQDLIHIPDFLKTELDNEVIGSYNAGILGGADLAFFKRYADEALNLVNANYNKESGKTPSNNFNILFEQILFYSLSQKEEKKVSTLFTETYNDNGYTTNMFADFTSVSLKLKYLHIIGAKKREEKICELLSRVLLKEYPDYFFKIVSLFKTHHAFFDQKIKFILPPSVGGDVHPDLQLRNIKSPLPSNSKTVDAETGSSITRETIRYQNHMDGLKEKWIGLPNQHLFDRDLAAIAYYPFFFMGKEQQLHVTLERHCYLEVIEDSFDWPDILKKSINAELINDTNEVYGLAYVPQLFFNGYNEFIIDEMDYNILVLLEEPTDMHKLISQISVFFEASGMDNNSDAIYDLILLKLRRLFLNKCIYLKMN